MAQGLGQGFDHLILIEFVGVPLSDPVVTGQFLVGRMELGQFPFAVQVPFHVGDVGMIAVVALQLVQNLEEDAEDGFATGSRVGLGVDVEQDHVGVRCHGPLRVGQQHGVFDLVLEELDRSFGLALVRVRFVVQ